MRADLPVLTAVAAGGALGALARLGVATAWPHQTGAFPWATWLINVTGCFLIGILMASIARRWPGQRFIRPFFGTGILGGYTTFSTWAVETLQSQPLVALVYGGATVAGALLAVWAGATLAGGRR